MLTDRLAELIARSLSKEATPAELEDLALHFQAHPEDQYFREILVNYWNSRRENFKEEDDLFYDLHFNHILALADAKAAPQAEIVEIEESARPRIRWAKRLSVAAIITGIVFAGAFFMFRPGKKTKASVPLQNEQIASRGARTKLQLPDGSQVWLNSETKLTYPDKFDESSREVRLEGEAYFDVVKDANRPFVVHTSGIDIHVLGTDFNVKSYASEPTIETTLIRGRVEIVQQNRPDAEPKILRPHMKAIYLKPVVTETKAADIKPSINKSPMKAAMVLTTLPTNMADTSIAETYWVYNKLVFDGEKFIEIAEKMGRWYNVKIKFKSDKVANTALHVSFTYETLEQALEALRISEKFIYTREGRCNRN